MTSVKLPMLIEAVFITRSLVGHLIGGDCDCDDDDDGDVGDGDDDDIIVECISV